MQRWFVAGYRSFGTALRFHLQESKSPRIMLDPSKGEREAVPKSRYPTTNQRYVTSQKNIDVIANPDITRISFHFVHQQNLCPA
jgi:hypothetical protein